MALGYLLYYNFYVLPKDVEKYETFIKKHKKEKHEQDNKVTYQTKTHVQKEIWQSSETGRLHSKILADEGLVSIKRQNKKIILQEKMKNILCLIQESLEEEDHKIFQNLRVLKAPLGVYDYAHHSFSSQKVFVDLYKIPLTNSLTYPLDYPSYLKGKAYHVFMTFKDHNPQFEALTFQADIQPSEDLKLK